MTSPSKSSVYISAVQENAAWVERIADRLRSDGISVWGHTLAFAHRAATTEVEQSREHCSVYILLLSIRYLDSDVIRRSELPRIQSLSPGEARIIYLVAERCDWQSVLPLRQSATIPADGSALFSAEEEQIAANLDALTQEVRRALAANAAKGSEEPPQVLRTTAQVGVPIESRLVKEQNAGEKRDLERNEDGDLLPLRELDRFSLSRTARHVLDRAEQLATARKASVNPVRPITLFFAMVEIGMQSKTPTTPRFLFEWFSANPTQKKAYESVLTQYVSETVEEHVGAGQMTADVLRLVEQASDSGQQTAGSSEIHARHLLGALLWMPRGYWMGRLLGGGVDFSQLRKDFQSFLGLNIEKDENLGAWSTILTGSAAPPAEAKSEQKVSPKAAAKADSWITQETFERFSKEALAVLSRANRISKDNKSRRIHTPHLLQAFRENEANHTSSGQLTELLKKHEADLLAVLSPRPIPKAAARSIDSLPPVSVNVRSALLTAINKAGSDGPIEESHVLFGVLSTATNDRVRELNQRGMTPDKVPLPVRRPLVEERMTSGLSTPTPKIVSDRWAEEDMLGYGAYARTLAGVIAHEETVPPLSIGIKAPWGAGKTSLMKQLQHILDGDAYITEENEATATINKDATGENTSNEDTSETPIKVSELLEKLVGEIQVTRPEAKRSKLGELYSISPRITVWFNAWKYQTSEQIWAGLAHCIISQVTARMTPTQRESFWLKLHARRVNKEAVRRKVTEFLLRAVAPTAFVGIACSLLIIVFVALRGIPWGWDTVAPALTVGRILWVRREKLGEKAADAFKELVREPDYEGKMGFLHLVESDIRDVLNLVATKQRPLVIFVDDLDRCVPRKVAEVVEAINLSLCGDYPNCIFVLGMEPGMVAAALEVANKDVIDKAKELKLLDATVPLGWRFMEKIVQLPINIPPPTEVGLIGYAESLTGWTPQERQGKPKEPEAPPPSPPTKEKVKEWKARLEGSNTVSEVVSRTEQLMEQAAPEERLAVAEASKQKYAEKFVDRDPIVGQFVKEVFGLVGGNPRQIKRYINVFRFHSTLRHNLKVDLEARGLTTHLPSDKGLAKFIAMGIQWPHAAEFLRKTRVIRGDGKSEGKSESLLKLLEKKSLTINGRNQKADAAWAEFLKSVELEGVEWIAAHSFREFLAEGETLSEIEGCGLW